MLRRMRRRTGRWKKTSRRRGTELSTKQETSPIIGLKGDFSEALKNWQRLVAIVKIMGKPHPKTEKKKNFLDELVWKEDTSIILNVQTMLKQVTDVQLNIERLLKRPK